ncbi:MAG TPA: hypothetical protein VLM79_40755 [Kofleriaceae bacterium]|nr:hypothetical protein [Kofleriaceae bacterium]
MTIATWRTIALVLAAVCVYQRWQSCTHECGSSATMAASAEVRRTTEHAPSAAHPAPQPPSVEEPAAPAAAGAAGAGGKSFHGFRIPAWAMRLTPQPGETLRAYRDRMLPLAELAVAPQRARVARLRDDVGQLDAHQRAELDADVADTAKAIQDRVARAVAAGELRPATLTPMTGVALARDVLDLVDRGNTRFLGTLRSDQRTSLASHRFDFADYLLFTARWEDALHALD